ncbi:unnamed protein product [Ectocarpus sp. 12 AP-2014]
MSIWVLMSAFYLRTVGLDVSVLRRFVASTANTHPAASRRRPQAPPRRASRTRVPGAPVATLAASQIGNCKVLSCTPRFITPPYIVNTRELPTYSMHMVRSIQHKQLWVSRSPAPMSVHPYAATFHGTTELDD